MLTVKELWDEYVSVQDNMDIIDNSYTSWHFCDNEKDANELLELVLTGTKRATASALLVYENSAEPIPEIGDLSVITNWYGEAKCIVRTSNVEIVPFCQVPEEFAVLEGEGDKSLEYWRKVHWEFFERDLSNCGKVPALDMAVVLETFNVICKSNV